MTKTQIARKFKVSRSLITDISKHRRYTRLKDLALHLGAITGKRPITFIHPDSREVFAVAHPIMTRRVREQVVIVEV